MAYHSEGGVDLVTIQTSLSFTNYVNYSDCNCCRGSAASEQHNQDSIIIIIIIIIIILYRRGCKFLNSLLSGCKYLLDYLLSVDVHCSCSNCDDAVISAT